MFMTNNQIWGELSMADLVKQDMIEYGITPSDLESKNVEDLIDHLAHILMIFSHCMFKNHTRQRSKLLLCFQEFGLVQEASERIDLKLYQEISGNEKMSKENPDPMRVMFSNYITELVIQVMIYFVQIGLYLELYSEHEYPVVYWYLDYLYGRWSVIKNAKMNFLHQKKKKEIEEAKAAARLSKRKKNGKKIKKPKKLESQPTPTPAHILLEGYQAMCRGLTRVRFIKITTYYLKSGCKLSKY